MSFIFSTVRLLRISCTIPIVMFMVTITINANLVIDAPNTISAIATEIISILKNVKILLKNMLRYDFPPFWLV